MLGKKLGIDLGTSMVRVLVKGEAAVYSEPSRVAVDERGEVVASGPTALEAERAGRPGLRFCSPLHHGLVRDTRLVEVLLSQLIARIVGRQRIFRPDLMIAVTPGLDGVARRAMLDTCARSGARTAYLLDSSLAAAIGAGLAIAGPRGQLAIDLGAGRTELTVIAMEGSVVRRSVPGGGLALSDAITSAILDSCGVVLGAPGAEEVKRELASAVPLHEERTLSIAIAAAPPLEVSSELIAPVMRHWLAPIDLAMRALLEETPPALREDLRAEGGHLTGGGAAMAGIDRHLAQVAGFPMRVAAEPEHCTVRGCGAALDNLDLLRRNLLSIR